MPQLAGNAELSAVGLHDGFADGRPMPVPWNLHDAGFSPINFSKTTIARNRRCPGTIGDIDGQHPFLASAVMRIGSLGG